MKCQKCNSDTGASWKTLCINCWKNRSTEELRQYRQAKLDRRVNRLLAKSERLEKEADLRQSDFNEKRQDWAWLTQPGHIPGREKALNNFEKGIKLNIEASELREKAKYLSSTKARVKGDAEAERQAKRESADKLISVGSRVFSPLFKEGEVLKVNKKTYTIKFDSGLTTTQDKSWIKLIQK